MESNVAFVFSTQQRESLELLPLAIAAYQYINGRVVTLLVSDGLCELVGKSRAELVANLDHEMFGAVHPEEARVLADLGYRFAVHGGTYDITYRVKLAAYQEYRHFHTIGRYASMPGGARVAYFLYIDVTDSQEHMLRTLQELDTPGLEFINENIGALAVVTRKDHRLLYHNQAIARILKPHVAFDSGMTFNQL